MLNNYPGCFCYARRQRTGSWGIIVPLKHSWRFKVAQPDVCFCVYLHVYVWENLIGTETPCEFVMKCHLHMKMSLSRACICHCSRLLFVSVLVSIKKKGIKLSCKRSFASELLRCVKLNQASTLEQRKENSNVLFSTFFSVGRIKKTHI